MVSNPRCVALWLLSHKASSKGKSIKTNETNMQSCYIVAALHYLEACPINFILSHDLPDKKKKPATSNITHFLAVFLKNLKKSLIKSMHP